MQHADFPRLRRLLITPAASCEALQHPNPRRRLMIGLLTSLKGLKKMSDFNTERVSD